MRRSSGASRRRPRSASGASDGTVTVGKALPSTFVRVMVRVSVRVRLRLRRRCRLRELARVSVWSLS